MAKTERIVLVCDACGVEDGAETGTIATTRAVVTTHQLRVDGASWWLEACGPCWRGVYRERIKALTKGVRTVRVPSKRPRQLHAAS